MIRAATVLDTPKILELVKQFYPKTSYSKWAPFCDATVTNLIDTLRKRGILLIAQHEDTLIGIVGFIGTPFIFNQDITSGHEVIWWVLPEFQKGSIGSELLVRAEQISQLKGWASLQMMRLESSPAVLDSFLVAHGYNPTEYCFTKVN